MELLDLDAAVRLLRTKVQPLADVDRIPLSAALGRVTARAEHAPRDIPAFANSAMDGYALHFNAADFSAPPPHRFPCVGVSYAGRGFAGAVPQGAVVRIFTGAPLPADCDTVVIQENTTTDGDVVQLLQKPVAGDWVRHAGHDLARGDTIVSAGTRLAPQHLGLAAAAGLTDIAVVRKPRIAFFSNGDELVDPGTTLAPGQIYDANRVTLAALLERLSVTAIDLGRAADTTAAIDEVLDRASAARADIVLCSGGVSVGDADLVRGVISRRGSIEFWRIALKPGKPVAFARVEGAWFIGLPGNPVSTFIAYLTLVRPAIEQLCGIAAAAPARFQARLLHDLRRDAGRLELQRGILGVDDDGTPTVRNTGNQSSGMLSSICAANCFIWLDREVGDVSAGEHVTVVPFAGYL